MLQRERVDVAGDRDVDHLRPVRQLADDRLLRLDRQRRDRVHLALDLVDDAARVGAEVDHHRAHPLRPGRLDLLDAVHALDRPSTGPRRRFGRAPSPGTRRRGHEAAAPPGRCSRISPRTFLAVDDEPLVPQGCVDAALPVRLELVAESLGAADDRRVICGDDRRVRDARGAPGSSRPCAPAARRPRTRRLLERGGRQVLRHP